MPNEQPLQILDARYAERADRELHDESGKTGRAPGSCRIIALRFA
jgi:hypothetical protein